MTSLNSMLTSESSENLGLFSQIGFYLQGRQDSAIEDVKFIAAKVLQCIKRLEDSDQPKMIYLLCKTLELTLQDQGHFTIYAKLLKELLNFAVVAKVTAHAINVLWSFQLLSTASTMIETKKIT